MAFVGSRITSASSQARSEPARPRAVLDAVPKSGEADARAATATWRRVLGAMVVALLVALVAQAGDLEQTLRGVATGRVERVLLEGAGWWRNVTAQAGLDRPVAAVRGTVRRAEELSWPEVKCLIVRGKLPAAAAASNEQAPAAVAARNEQAYVETTGGC